MMSDDQTTILEAVAAADFARQDDYQQLAEIINGTEDLRRLATALALLAGTTMHKLTSPWAAAKLIERLRLAAIEEAVE